MSEYKFGDPVWVLYGSSGRLKALVLNQPPNSDTAYVAVDDPSAGFVNRYIALTKIEPRIGPARTGRRLLEPGDVVRIARRRTELKIESVNWALQRPIKTDDGESWYIQDCILLRPHDAPAEQAEWRPYLGQQVRIVDDCHHHYDKVGFVRTFYTDTGEFGVVLRDPGTGPTHKFKANHLAPDSTPPPELAEPVVKLDGHRRRRCLQYLGSLRRTCEHRAIDESDPVQKLARDMELAVIGYVSDAIGGAS